VLAEKLHKPAAGALKGRGLTACGKTPILGGAALQRCDKRSRMNKGFDASGSKHEFFRKPLQPRRTWFSKIYGTAGNPCPFKTPTRASCFRNL
jgi:hypothetical protein